MLKRWLISSRTSSTNSVSATDHHSADSLGISEPNNDSSKGTVLAERVLRPFRPPAPLLSSAAGEATNARDAKNSNGLSRASQQVRSTVRRAHDAQVRGRLDWSWRDRLYRLEFQHLTKVGTVINGVRMWLYTLNVLHYVSCRVCVCACLFVAVGG